jgi:hypothetical protein
VLKNTLDPLANRLGKLPVVGIDLSIDHNTLRYFLAGYALLDQTLRLMSNMDRFLQ